MKAIILAAGKGERLMPLTQTKPKPMIKVFGKPILEHVIESIESFVNNIIIVVKYYKEAIIEEFGDNFKGVPIDYIVQGEEKGTAAALKNIDADEDLLILNGDTIYDVEDIRNLVENGKYGILVKEVSTPSLYGIFEINEKGFIQKVIEKPPNPPSKLANVGAYKLPPKILKYARNVSLSSRGEYELTDALNNIFSEYEIKAITLSGEFLDVGFPWHILKVNSYFFSKYKPGIYGAGEIEEGVQIYPDSVVILSPGSKIKKGTIIAGNLLLGANSVIGPNAFVRGDVVVGNKSSIGFSVEIKNSAIGDGTKVSHLSYIGDSVVGNNVNIGGGTMVANLRHDKKTVSYLVKGKLVNTGLRKFGCVIGDNAKLGIKTLVYPGRQIAADQMTLPGEIIK